MWSRLKEFRRYSLLLVLAVLLTACQGGHHRSHMRQMIEQRFAGKLPPGIEAATLPDSEGQGAQLIQRYCSTCHAIPSPKAHTAGEWPAVVKRMVGHMRRFDRGMMRMVEVPAPDEREQLLAYLREHALSGFQPDSSKFTSPEGRLFADRCSSCHALPSPGLHEPDAWPGVVDRMIENMQAMNRTPLTPKERTLVIDFLQTQARSDDPE